MATSTSGFFQGQEYHLDLVRLGTVNYLFGNQSSSSAARWLTRITGIKQVEGSEGASKAICCFKKSIRVSQMRSAQLANVQTHHWHQAGNPKEDLYKTWPC